MFESPYSYWDRSHGAQGIARIEVGMAIGALAMLWMRRLPIYLLAPGALLLAAEIWIVRQWLFFFIDS